MAKKHLKPRGTSALQNEDEEQKKIEAQWLGELRDMLSPYWSSRVEYHPEKKTNVLVVEQATRRSH